jgi:hypothetical protein
MLSVANYLAGLTNLAQAATSGLSAAASSGSVAAGISTGLSSLFGAGSLEGSRPRALHTEYASGEANWQKPYGSNTDIVFYLSRADLGGSGAALSGLSGEDSLGIFAPGQSQNTLGSEAFSTNLGFNYSEGMEAVGPTFGAAVQTGAGFPTNVQSPLNQIGVRRNAGALASFTSGAKGLAGPLTGLNIADKVPVGSFSQTFAKISSMPTSVKNLTQYVPSLESLRLSGPSSEKFFSGVLTNSFIPDFGQGEGVSAVRSASQIQSSISNGSISDLSSMLSLASGGVTTSQQLVEGINKGLIGFTTPGSKAEAERIGPQGYSRERLAK